MSKFATVQIDPSLLKLDKLTRRGIVSGLAEIGDRAENNIKKLPAPRSYIDRTSHLRNSIKRDAVDEVNLLVKVVANADYGHYVNDGTYDKRKGGKGISPRKFMEKGLKLTEPIMESVMVKHLTKAGV